MTKKIYEYKDEHNWFIGQWSVFETVDSFVAEDLWGRFKSVFNHLSTGNLYFHIVFIRYQSKERFIRFLVDMVNDTHGRQLSVYSRQGAIVVAEAGRILYIDLPETGVSATEFFGQGLTSPLSLGDTILIATRNEGKTKEFRQLFEQLGLGVENLNDYPDLPEVEETGTTFEENARLKAETIANLTGKMVLADDSGLKVDVLGGLPGVWSARFSGPDATDERNNAKLLHELAMVFNKEDRSAQFHCTLVVAAPGKESLVVVADWPGYIGFEAKGEHGFGYDPLFLVGESSLTSAQLLPHEKNEQSHRGLAVKKLLEVFPAWQASHVL